MLDALREQHNYITFTHTDTDIDGGRSIRAHVFVWFISSVSEKMFSQTVIILNLKKI